jgi:hypothetical protein
MKTELRVVTPEIAKEMLSRNHGNRNVSDRHVEFLSSQMKGDRWVFDGQPIRFNVNGRLLDGQHRLNAIIKSGKEQQFLIVTGIESSAFKVMDTGKNRNSSDVFKIQGIDYGSQVSVTTRLVYNIKQGTNAVSTKVSNSELLEYFESNESILDCVKQSEKLYKEFGRILSWTHIAAFMYLFSEKSVTESEDFFNKLCTGLDLSINSPIYVLRKKLMSDAVSIQKLPRNDKYALIIKSWNHYRKGSEVKFLKWNKEIEKFPTII